MPDGKDFHGLGRQAGKNRVPIAIHAADRINKGGGYKDIGIYIARIQSLIDQIRNKPESRFKSSEQEECKAVALVQIIHENVESVYLYLTHDSKDAIKKGKYRYDKRISNINNFDIERYITVDVGNKEYGVKRILIIWFDVMGLSKRYWFAIIRSKRHGYGIDNLFFAAIENKTSILKLYFDAAYQSMYVWKNLKKVKKWSDYNFIKSEEAKQIYTQLSFVNFKRILWLLRKRNEQKLLS